MKRPTLLLLLFLSCHALQQVSSQTAAGDSNTQQPATEMPTSGGEPITSSGESAPEIPIASDGSVTDGVDSLSVCEASCSDNCNSIDSECEFIDGVIPVLCGDEIETCKAECETFCSCQSACGCDVADGCDDLCSQECESPFILVEEQSTTVANGPAAGAAEDGLQVVYKKEDEDGENSNDQD